MIVLRTVLIVLRSIAYLQNRFVLDDLSLYLLHYHADDAIAGPNAP